MSPRTFGQGDVAGPGAADHVLVETSSDLYGQGDTFTGVYTYGNALLRRNSEYALYDGHGSERTVTASSQSVIGTINFEAFGQTAGSTGSSSSPYMYAGAWGYRTDGDAGLMHVGARYYDAQVGRFITRDTVLSEHPYLYCEHDAVNKVDPSGHDWFDNTSDFFAGWGDSLTGGATGIIRGWMIGRIGGEGDGVNHDSGYYFGGQIVGVGHSVALGGATILRPGTAAVQRVSQWGPEGSPWVMTGPPSLRNWIFSGVGLRKGYGFSTGRTWTVPGANLCWPRGWEWIKGFIGQRIIRN